MPIFQGVVIDFRGVMLLCSLTKREAGACVDRAAVKQMRTSSTVRTYGTSGLASGADYSKAVQAESEAKAALEEARLVYVLVQDRVFCQELADLKRCWDRFRMHVPGARDDQFFGNLMLGEGTEHGDALHVAWKTVSASVVRVHSSLASSSSILL